MRSIVRKRVFFSFPNTRSIEVRIQVGLSIVVGKDLVVLPALLHEAKLPALPGLEVVFNPHRDGCRHAREAEHHHADESAIAKADDGIGFDGIKKLASLL